MEVIVTKRCNVFPWIFFLFCVFVLVLICYKKPMMFKDVKEITSFNTDFKYVNTTEKSKPVYVKEVTSFNTNFKDFKYVKTTEKPKPAWIILLIINNGYLDFFQNWFHYYRKLHLEYEVVVIAEDDIAYLNLQKFTVKLRFTLVKSGRLSSSDPSDYGSEAFATLTSGRPGYILKYLLDGKNIVYADVDAVWMLDPFPYFSGDFDMWIQVDAPNVLCTGFMAIKNCKESIKLMEMWIESLRQHVQIDQNAFNGILPHSKIRLRRLDELHFPSGKLYFDTYSNESKKNAVIVHNNYIIGHPAKLQRFRENNLWFS